VSDTRPKLAVLGAGKLGITIAQLAIKAGYEVFLSGSGAAEKIKLTATVLAPGAIATETKDAVLRSEIIILALPLGKFPSLPQMELSGKLVVDAMNYWWEVDGSREAIIPSGTSSSEAVQEFLPGSRIVKALNHMGYHHLHDEPKIPGAADRKAIAIAGDDPGAIAQVEQLVDALGFDAIVIGGLAEGKRLEPGMNTFGANVSAVQLHQLVAEQR
jgi:predicted dinucleotide-binding enzyme